MASSAASTSTVVDVSPNITAAREQAKAGDVAGAVDALLLLERQRRRAEDEAAVKEVVVAVVQVCFEAGDWKLLASSVVLLAKRRSQFPQAIVKMVNEVVGYLDHDSVPSEASAMLLDTLLVVCEGKIFVEVQRARLTRRRALAKEAAGELKEAAKELQDVQIETLGSMEKEEKLDFILEQMRLCLGAGDWLRVLIISRKIHRKVFARNAFQPQKLKFHELLIEYHQHEGNFLHVARSLLAMYNTPSVLDSADAAWKAVLARAAVFIVLAKQAPDQQDLLHRIKKEKRLAEVGDVYDLVNLFTTTQIMDWPQVESQFGAALRELPGGLFSDSEDGAARFEHLRSRVIEHNIRIIANYYSRIALPRLAALLSLNVADAESRLCDMVVDGAIYAKVDRLASVVSFVKPATSDEILNEWASDVGKLLSIVEKCNHNLQKENMMHKIDQ
ncbi:proteasome 26S subunit [Thecamonas trahens ATCC 50062]|uniref:Proteasome 26S subunit n=1 Tax=Thecamonas trahens ATCC 50062 TaxID=461836 RepID=A0A0L0DLH8_THETB|nr:proteasome 26S subunit [Thecamonas trahens ATCC 50062]KNC53157.1 proteasome 26S subunit [Thecamonas trahens ATCC 50062]|eukprot:XP_013754630.1 proteasome 26S subunit [Thecamonas trahens ATCC 50062]